MLYRGSCHCSQIQFEVDLELTQMISCNCSICKKKGYLLAFVPDEHFKLVSGESELKDYQFGKKNVHHYFCSHCGVTSFASGKGPDGKKMCAINIRCLIDVNLDSIKIQNFDGASL